MWEGTTSRVTVADRTYSKFYDFYSASLENFGSTHVYHLAGACVHTKQAIPLPFQYKLALPDNQFILSSSWLHSPRFKLRTLTGYILPQKDEMVRYGEQTCQIIFFIQHLYVSHIITYTRESISFQIHDLKQKGLLP